MPKSNTRSRSITAPAAEERGRRGGAVPQGGPARQPDRAEPPRPRAGQWTGAPGRQGRGSEWHIVAKTAGKGDPSWTSLADVSPEDRAKAQEAARKWIGNDKDSRLDGGTRQGTRVPPTALAALAVFLLTHKPRIMLHSALINVMVKAARNAGRSLKRDLGEIEYLQVSLKGPANFVTQADKRAEELLYAELPSRGRVTASSARKAARAKAPTRATPGSSIPWTAPPTSCTASRNSRSRSPCSAKASSLPASSTIPPTTSSTSPSAARAPTSTSSGCVSPPPQARRMRDRLRAAAYRPRRSCPAGRK